MYKALQKCYTIATVPCFKEILRFSPLTSAHC